MNAGDGVVVVGDALLDVHVVPGSPVRPGEDVPGTIELRPGGQGANVALRLARRGIATRLVCGLADDAAGTILREALGAAPVELAAAPVERTGTVVVLRGADGERTMISERQPIATRAASTLEAAPAPGWLVLSGYPLAEPDADALAAEAATAERRLVLGCALGPADVAAWAGRLATIRPSLLVLNDREATQLGDAKAAGEIVVVTSATDVWLTAPGSAPLEVPVRSSDGKDAIDTTGAGDAFAAGLLAALLDAPWPPDAGRLRIAVESALALAALVIRVRGAQAEVSGEGGGTLGA